MYSRGVAELVQRTNRRLAKETNEHVERSNSHAGGGDVSACNIYALRKQQGRNKERKEEKNMAKYKIAIQSSSYTIHLNYVS